MFKGIVKYLLTYVVLKVANLNGNTFLIYFSANLKESILEHLLLAGKNGLAILTLTSRKQNGIFKKMSSSLTWSKHTVVDGHSSAGNLKVSDLNTQSRIVTTFWSKLSKDNID